MENKTFAEINLDNLASNVSAIGKQVYPSKIIPVAKADAYGHGAVPVTKRLMREGLTIFAVSNLNEAMELRESGVYYPILIFGRLFPDEISIAIRLGFRITIFGQQDIQWIENSKEERPAFVHLNMDTGMGRAGVIIDQDQNIFNQLVDSKRCAWEGLYSHFSTSDEKDKTYANIQLSRFKKILSLVQKLDKKPSIIHMANSGAILNIADSYFDAVRPGILLYGHYPSSETSEISHSITPKQVMTLKTTVSQVRQVPKDFPVSYGRKWITKKQTKIAVLPIGYSDGISRMLTNKGEVLIRGKLYPMVGTLTMDYTMIDVGNDPIETGDEVLLWGKSPQGEIQAIKVAEKIGTIPYELTCNISARVKRIYIGDY
jgi:alanine racemase